MMKILIPFFTLIICNICFAQYTDFIYEYKQIPDSTNRKNVVTELMVLSVSKEKSEFYNLNQFKNDSTVAISNAKGFPPPPQSFRKTNFRIIKNTSNKSKLNNITSVSTTTYNVSESMNLKWKMIPEFKEILGYKAQKAVTNYGGRTWNAWFTKEIPIQEGPYKFSSLPGLILKIEDTKDNHIFEIKAIKKSSKVFEYPQNKYVSEVNIDYPKYEKAFKLNRKNPTAGMVHGCFFQTG